MMPQSADPAASATPESALQSMFDKVIDGGPMMVPLALCSIVALAYIVERSVRLRGGRFRGRRFPRELTETLRRDGVGGALELCLRSRTAMARIMAVGLRRWEAPFLEREKAVEDAAAIEVRRLSVNLRPLVVIAMIAPLLGLLGTVWGMIEAFSNIALKDGLGKPELLASGISQALITTATGLAIAIPAQAAYFYFKSRVDRFARETEDLYLELHDALDERAASVGDASPAPAAPSPGAPVGADASATAAKESAA